MPLRKQEFRLGSEGEVGDSPQGRRAFREILDGILKILRIWGGFGDFDRKLMEGFKGLGRILDFGFVYQILIRFRLDLIAFVGVGTKFYSKTSARNNKLWENPQGRSAFRLI